MSGTRLRARLEAGEVIKMINPHDSSYSLAARLIGHGADAVFVDCEHGSWGFEDVRMTQAAVRAAGGDAIVRPRSHDRSLIIRYINCGADGVMVPMVDDADEARAIVDAVQYASSHDKRSTLVICMIENVDTARNKLDAMLDVEGVDVFFLGPSDLTKSMGLAPPSGNEDWNSGVKEVITETIGRITARGKIAGTLVREDNARHYNKAGAQFLYLHADPMLRAGFASFDRALSS
ncbi:MAG: hypothetical protein KDF64_21980 [Geminicoccaceae bacterium]|nr:hypothetical protein [Geminicoccaceae bacterium]